MLVEDQNVKKKDNHYISKISDCNGDEKCKEKIIDIKTNTRKAEDTKYSAALMKEWGAWDKGGNSNK